MALSKITTASLSDNAVTTAKITDANITTAKMADANVTTAKVADDAITTAKVNPAQTDITSVGTLTSFATTGIDDNASSEMLNLEQNANSTTSKMLMVGENNNVNGWSFNGRSGIVIEGTSNAILALGRSSTASQSAYIYHDGTLGITNQEATNINIGYNTGTAVAITSDKHVTKPYTPYFFGGRSAGQTGSGNDFVSNVTQDNRGSHYNTSNGRFTAPVTGEYLCHFKTFSSPQNLSAGHYQASLRINDTAFSIFYFYHTGSNHEEISWSQIVRIAKDDYVTHYLHGSLTVYGSDWTYAQQGFYLIG